VSEAAGAADVGSYEAAVERAARRLSASDRAAVASFLDAAADAAAKHTARLREPD
jgi:hypothetical protein